MATNWWDELTGFAVGVRDRVVSEHDQAVYLAGFESAVGVFRPLVDSRIEVLDSKLESGTLTPDDQKTLATLRSLRNESDTRLVAHLNAEGFEPSTRAGH